MGSKCKIKKVVFIAGGLFILCIAISLILNFNTKYKDFEHYTELMITKLESDNEFEVREIFDFEFDRAYVFKDSYISGEGFSESYNIDISISEVQATDQEYIRRIIFVNQSGHFVYEFQYNSNVLNAYTEGMIIYSDTKIQKCEPKINGAITFQFLDIKDYY